MNIRRQYTNVEKLSQGSGIKSLKKLSVIIELRRQLGKALLGKLS